MENQELQYKKMESLKKWLCWCSENTLTNNFQCNQKLEGINVLGSLKSDFSISQELSIEEPTEENIQTEKDR